MNTLFHHLNFATNLCFLLGVFTFGENLEAAASASTSPSSSSTKKSSTPPPAPAPARGRVVIPHAAKGPTSKAPAKLFVFPGVIQWEDDEWKGSDNFVNLSQETRVQANVLMPEKLKLAVNPASMEKIAWELLSKAKFLTMEEELSAKPPLPFLRLNVMIYPVQSGFAGVVNVALFEEVKLDRVQLDKDYVFQAITWEQSQLIVAPEKDFLKELEETVKNIISDFIKRASAYQTPRPH